MNQASQHSADPQEAPDGRGERSYYDINRSTWPDLSRVQAAWDALKLACRVKGWLPMKGRL